MTFRELSDQLSIILHGTQLLSAYGEWPETPEGVRQKRFRDNIREWLKIEESCGPEALKRNKTNRVWKAEEKYELVAKVIAGGSLTSIALKRGINPGMLY